MGKLSDKLEIEFQGLRERGVSCFDSVQPGECKDCYKGQQGYSFLAKDGTYINFLFYLTGEDHLEDLVSCSDMCCSHNLEDRNRIFLQFDRDDEPGFLESVDFLIKKQKIERALVTLDNLNQGLVDVDDLIQWLEQYQDLYPSLMERATARVRAFKTFEHTYALLTCFTRLKEDHEVASQAMADYIGCGQDEDKIENWIEKYRTHSSFSAKIEFLDGWRKSGLVKFLGAKHMIVDCSPLFGIITFSKDL